MIVTKKKMPAIHIHELRIITHELKSLSLDYFSLDNYLSYRKVAPLHALFIPEHSVKGTVSVITSDPVKGIVSVISSDPPCRDGNV